MSISRATLTLALIASFSLVAHANDPFRPTTEELKAAYSRADSIAQARGAAFKLSLDPNWFGGDRFFWYRNLLPGGKSEFVLVDAEKPSKGPAFDHARLAEALAKALGKPVSADKLPFQRIEPAADLKTVRFDAGDKKWECDLAAYSIRSVGEASTPPPGGGRGGRGGAGAGAAGGGGRQAANTSPDRKWIVRVQDGKVRVFPVGSDTAAYESTFDSFQTAQWAPDSSHLVAFRVIPGDRKQVFLIESSPKEGGRAKLVQRDYDLPGDKVDTFETFVLDMADKTERKVEIEPIYTGGRPYLGPPRAQWTRDGKAFRLQVTDRGYQRERVFEVDLASRKVRTLADEHGDTFVDTTALLRYDCTQSDEMIWRSERDGWGRLYLIDTGTSAVKGAITPTGWVVRSIENVDEKTRRVVFTANNTDDAQDPYHIHAFSVGFDGKGLVRLTAGDGTHTAKFSPGYKFLVDTYSRVDAPPVHVLRRMNGTEALRLEEADLSEWAAHKVPPVERFTAKGRDGVTDIYGVVFRPSDLDPNRSYPIIENIYAGPHDSFVPKAFSALNGMQQLAELGFIVVQIDGMGTRNRGKKFHDVCWQNIADAGFPDRIPWMQALAAKYPNMDISRVGVYGTSAGGQSSTGAMLFHPEFYKVAVSSCGCHDNRMDKVWWNEQWMGLIGPHYEAQSNITNAAKLQGNLLLLLGELDTNVPPESTFRLVDALEKARKEFDFVIIPGSDHTSGGPYGERKRRDFFVRHLHGVNPPSWNGG